MSNRSASIAQWAFHTFRPEFETPWRSEPHQTQIALNRLTRRQIRDMMRRRLGGAELREAVVDQIVERTDGIPLFIEEFTAAVRRKPALYPQPTPPMRS
jgi:predicted ATPase